MTINAIAEALIEALTLAPDRMSFTWFGARQTVSAPGVEVLARDARLVESVRRCIYQNFYCRGEPTPFSDAASPAFAREDSPFVRALLEANKFRLTWFDGSVVSAGARYLTCRVNGADVGIERSVRMMAGGMVLDAAKRAELEPGAKVRLGVPGWSLTASPGFLILSGHSRSMALPHRVYWHISAGAADRFVAAATAEFAALRAPVRMKLLANPEPYESRRDCAVTYLDLGQPDVLEAVRNIAAGSKDWLRHGVPAFTRALAAGVSIAEDPAGQSFGMHRSGAIAEAALAASNEWSAEALADSIKVAFIRAGIDPQAPWGPQLAWIEPFAGSRAATPAARIKAPAETAAPDFLAVANRIGETLIERSLVHQGRRQWIGGLPGLYAGNATAALQAGLYDGTAGIGLFLAELGYAAGNDRMMAAGLEAFRQALAQRRPSANFYIGGAGIAAAAIRAARRAGDDDLAEAALTCAHACLDAPPEAVSDLLTGLAGDILGLLTLAEVTADSAYQLRAVALGETLLERAVQREADEVSWWHPRIGGDNHPTGFSHGVSGIAYVLALLFERTANTRFAQAAASGLRYEDRLLNRAKQNWPDFRFEGEQQMGMRHWCHGAGGIVLCRPYLVQMLNIRPHPDILPAAAMAFGKTIERQSKSTGNSYSLCHGLIGNAEILETVARSGALPISDASMLSRIVMQTWKRGADRHGMHAAWPVGMAHGNPSLMLGLAGIGYAALRMRDPTVPSILLPRPSQWHST